MKKTEGALTILICSILTAYGIYAGIHYEEWWKTAISIFPFVVGLHTIKDLFLLKRPKDVTL